MSRESWGKPSNINSKIPINFIENFFKKHINVDGFSVSSGNTQATFSINIDKDILLVLTRKLQIALWDSSYFDISVEIKNNRLFSCVVSEKKEKIAKTNKLLSTIDAVDRDINDKLSEIEVLKNKHNIVDSNIKSSNKKPRIIL